MAGEIQIIKQMQYAINRILNYKKIKYM